MDLPEQSIYTQQQECYPVLQMLDIWKSFGGVQALQGVSLTCYPGEVHALLGANGAGKSTLMNILVGAVVPDKGEILLNGQRRKFHKPSDAIQAGIAIIRQEFDLVPGMTVAENIFLGREPLKRGGVVDIKRMENEANNLLQILETDIPVDILVSHLSVAQQQLVMIAKALSLQAQIIIMDEPSTSLAQNELRRLFELTRNLSQQGKTVIYISHRLEEIYNICGCATILRDGTLVGTVELCKTSQNELIRMMVGDGKGIDQSLAQHNPTEILLEARNLTQAGTVRNISLHVRKGEVIGIAGLMGAGKTTIARLLFGAERLDEGEVLLEGKTMKLTSPGKAIHSGVYLLPEDRRVQGLFINMSIRENLGIANLDKITHLGFVSKRKEEVIAQDAVRDLNIITTGIGKIVRFLSGGNQQKVAFAKCLTNRPKVMILDEPTRGIDVSAKQEIYQLIHRLAQQGTGVIVASSELPELLRLADRIYVLFAGRLMGELSKAEATEEKILALASGVPLSSEAVS